VVWGFGYNGMVGWFMAEWGICNYYGHEGCDLNLLQYYFEKKLINK